MEFRPMSPEEMQRTVQFLLTQQAQFASDLASLNGQVTRIADAVVGLTGIVSRLTEAQARTDEQLKATDLRLNRLADHIDRVDSHLNVVIEMFERHLGEDQGPRPS
jgi:septal ring factor EnvC (AmiA/AmiB activator)